MMIDPVTGLAVAGGVATALPIAYKIGQKIVNFVKGWFKGDKSTREKNPNPQYILDDEDLKLVQTMAPEEKAFLDSIINLAAQNPEAFIEEFDKTDLSKAEQAAEAPFPNADQLGLPPSQPNFIQNLMQGTDFAPIQNELIRKYKEEIVPNVLERLTGLGQSGRSSAFSQGIGQATERLGSQLGSLGAEYNLKRAGTLGGLGLKQQALDLGRAETAQRLGMGQQQQRFGQQQALAGLGLQQRGQDIANRQAQQQSILNLLGLAKGVPITNQNQSPSWQALSGGIGAGLLGTAAKMYGNQQDLAQQQSQFDQKMELLKQFNQIDKGLGLLG